MDSLRNNDPLNRDQSGISILELVIAMGIFNILIVLMMRHSTESLRSTKQVDQRLDFSQIERTLLQNLNCNETFKVSIGKTQPDAASCSSTSYNAVPPWITVMKQPARGGPQKTFGGAIDGDGSFEFGNLRVRISCSFFEASLIVQAVPNAAGARPWNTKKSLVIGGAQKKYVCFEKEEIGRIATASGGNGALSPERGSPGSAFKILGNAIGCREDRKWGLSGCVPLGGGIEGLKVMTKLNACASASGVRITCVKTE
jgi:hypothetical protein